jgi:hypothetical protein
MPPLQVFADTGNFLTSIPDVVQLYSNTRPFAFIVDVILLCILFAEGMKIAAERARMSKRFGAILGIIFGTSLTFAIHAAGYTLLQHWFVWIIIAVITGIWFHQFTKETWGGWSILGGFALAMGILAIGRGASAGEFSSGIVSWIIWIMAIVGIIVLITRLFSKGKGGGDGGPGPGPSPGPTPGPDKDLTPILAAIAQLNDNIGKGFAKQTEIFVSSLEKVEKAVADLKGILDNILANIQPLKDFFAQWNAWAGQVLQRFDTITAEVSQNGKLLAQHIANMAEWQKQWETFRSGVNVALTDLTKKMDNALDRLARIANDILEIENFQQKMNQNVGGMNAQLAKLGQDLGALPANVVAELRPDYQAISGELGTVVQKLDELTPVKQRVDEVLEILKKRNTPELQGVIQKIESSKNAILKAIADLSSDVDKISKKGEDGQAQEVTALIANVQQAGNDVRDNVNVVGSTLNEIEDTAPLLSELLGKFKSLETVKDLKGVIDDLSKRLGKLSDKVGKHKKARAEAVATTEQQEAKEAAQEEEEVQDLDKIDALLIAQYTTLNAILTNIKKTIKGISTIKFRTESKTVWEGQLRAEFRRVSESVGTIQMDKKTMDATLEQLTIARTHLNKHIENADPREQAGLRELDSRLAGFEQQQKQIRNFLLNAKIELLAIGNQVIKEQKKGEVPDIQAIITALLFSVKQFERTVKSLKVSQATLRVETRKKIAKATERKKKRQEKKQLSWKWRKK